MQFSSVPKYMQKNWTALTVPAHCVLQKGTITKVTAKRQLGTYGTILCQNSRTQDASVGHMKPPAKNPYKISFW